MSPSFCRAPNSPAPWRPQANTRAQAAQRAQALRRGRRGHQGDQKATVRVHACGTLLPAPLLLEWFLKAVELSFSCRATQKLTEREVSAFNKRREDRNHIKMPHTEACSFLGCDALSKFGNRLARACASNAHGRGHAVCTHSFSCSKIFENLLLGPLSRSDVCALGSPAAPTIAC
jgi:hypothetical protein